jgi:hypothetical protein
MLCSAQKGQIMTYFSSKSSIYKKTIVKKVRTTFSAFLMPNEQEDDIYFFQLKSQFTARAWLPDGLLFSITNPAHPEARRNKVSQWSNQKIYLLNISFRKYQSINQIYSSSTTSDKQMTKMHPSDQKLRHQAFIHSFIHLADIAIFYA